MTPKKLRAWETISRETILDHGKWLTVENHTVKLPDGRIIPDGTLAHHSEPQPLCSR